jgi:hypothetical protein
MNEQEIRGLVRDAIARLEEGAPSPRELAQRPAADPHLHVSHGMFTLPAADDRCLIEPVVRCTHCGYCKSYGH